MRSATLSDVESRLQKRLGTKVTIVNGRRGITASTALRFAKFFGTTPGFWMNLQQRWDLYFALQDETDTLKKIARHG